MKNGKTVLMTAVVMMGAFGSLQSVRAAGPARQGNEVTVNINTAVLPSGYDTSEPVAIISGMFPNSCYRWNRATVDHVGGGVHEVRAVANVSPGMCLMVLIPFSEEVEIGKLDRGTHVIRFMNGDGTYQEKKVVVEK